jgi:quercetin dioxygenase-like cupin family protein
MKIKSFNEGIEYNNDKIVASVILETAFSKEIRILMKEGQVMKEHKAPFPIMVHILEGLIDFGVQGKVSQLEKGDILSLDASVPHNLKALTNSVIRLSLSKMDNSNRVKDVIKS